MFTHHHVDHNADFISLFVPTVISKKPIAIYGPSKTTTLAHLPFDYFKELLVRINAALKRTPVSYSQKTLFEVANLNLYMTNKELRIDNKIAELTLTELSLRIADAITSVFIKTPQGKLKQTVICDSDDELEGHTLSFDNMSQDLVKFDRQRIYITADITYDLAKPVQFIAKALKRKNPRLS